MRRDQSQNGNSLERGFQHLQEAQAKLTEAMASLVSNQAAFQSETGGTDPIRFDGMHKADARAANDLILQFQTKGTATS
ncbi:MAG: hypothetical protein HY000_31430 [Planctomycetes bacterium]|nr:hypothetical protein [Planctomycetota bacterium]